MGERRVLRGPSDTCSASFAGHRRARLTRTLLLGTRVNSGHGGPYLLTHLLAPVREVPLVGGLHDAVQRHELRHDHPSHSTPFVSLSRLFPEPTRGSVTRALRGANGKGTGDTRELPRTRSRDRLKSSYKRRRGLPSDHERRREVAFLAVFWPPAPARQTPYS